MTISGWGSTSQSGSQSPILKAAFVTGVTNPACAAAGYGKNITKNMLCASTKAFDTDACQGDSGGSNPVLQYHGHKPFSLYFKFSPKLFDGPLYRASLCCGAAAQLLECPSKVPVGCNSTVVGSNHDTA